MYLCILLTIILFVGIALLINGAVVGEFIYLIVGILIMVIILLICLQWYKLVRKSYARPSQKVVPLPLPLPMRQMPLTPRDLSKSKPMVVVKKPVFELI